MEKLLLMKVHFLDDRYYGEGAWPPSPARLFQALVAGNAVGDRLPDECVEALGWLEAAPPPEIRAQRGRRGIQYISFVPNNDLDSLGGRADAIILRGGKKGPAISFIRTEKRVQPYHINAEIPICYLWRFSGTESAVASATCVCAMADNIYRLGRGVDIAWVDAVVLDLEIGTAEFDAISGDLFIPGTGLGNLHLDCPQRGSLASLMKRYHAHRRRFTSVTDGRRVNIYFVNPPKSRFQRVAYNPTAQWRLFDLRSNVTDSEFLSWPQERSVSLVAQVRDKIAERLTTALPEQAGNVERVIVGRDAGETDKALRVRLIPLPSIGHEKTNHSIRRVMVVVPSGCPIRITDIEWAMSGLILDEGQGTTALVKAEDLSMLRHYGVASEATTHLWRTVTPVVVPQSASRRRIDPKQRIEQAKGGAERIAEEQRASSAVIQALRHAGIHARVESVRVQREPFSGRGARAEAFAEGTRFAKERLWHVELRFAEPLAGPLVIGDGRYLGLGLLAPERECVGALAYLIEDGLSETAEPEQVAHALRRAVMARVQLQFGKATLPSFFTGHASDGSPLREGNHRHLAFLADFPSRRLIIAAPHLLEGREPYNDERNYVELLGLAMRDMTVLRAGGAGCLTLSQTPIDFQQDRLFGRSRRWESVTVYRPTRHAKKMSPATALTADILREVERRGLPRPEVEVLSVHEGPRGGLVGRIRMEFHGAEPGPIVLGKTCHMGGGLFGGCDG